MYFNGNEIKAIAQMLEYYDTTGEASDLSEVIGVVRFKVLEDTFEREDEEKRKAQKALEQAKESEVSVDK